jgi:hypothetical protein
MKTIDTSSLFLFKAVFLILLVFNLFDLFVPERIGNLGDELCCILVLILMFLRIVWKKSVPSQMTLFVPFFFILFLLGVCGNIFYPYMSRFNCIARDAFLFFKPYIFMVFGLVFANQSRDAFLTFLQKVSKVMICMISFMAVLNYLGKFGLEKYGLFTFFSTSTSGCVAWWLILFVCLVFVKPAKSRFCYLVLAAVALIFIDSGLGNFSLAMVIPIYLFIEKRKKINIKYFFLIVPIGLYLAGSEISTYLMNDRAPRYIMHKFAFITANECFPFGSGFGTYGGNTAIDYYSALYYKYGFNYLYGMSRENSSFLMDSYYPMVIAQFGYIGVVAFLFMIMRIMKKLLFTIEEKNLKVWIIFLFGVWLVAGLGFGTGSNWGCCVLFLVGALSGPRLYRGT